MVVVAGVVAAAELFPAVVAGAAVVAAAEAAVVADAGHGTRSRRTPVRVLNSVRFIPLAGAGRKGNRFLLR